MRQVDHRPDPEYLEKIKNKDPSVTEVDASCRQLQGSRHAPPRRACAQM